MVSMTVFGLFGMVCLVVLGVIQEGDIASQALVRIEAGVGVCR